MDDLINNIDIYRRIAMNSYDLYLKSEERLKKCHKNALVMGPDGIEFSYKLHIKMYEYAVQVVVFSALLLEAFANDFLIEKIGEKDFELLDKLEVKGKILIGTKMVTGKDFPKDKVAYNRMSKLISMRNKLVHAKSVDVNSSASKIYFEIDKKDMEDAMSAYKLVIEEIDRIDSSLKLKECYLLPDEKIRDWFYLHA